MNFENLNLAPAIVDAVREQGYVTPTPIQQQAIPAVLAGHDLLAGAQTGTGKTAAFALPILHKLNAAPAPQPGAIRALVLTPTRELAAQVQESMRVYGQNLPLTSTVVFGGVGLSPQIDRLQQGVDILVATPGRLLDLENQRHLDLSHVEILVLDEADRMLDMGFIHDVKKVLALLPKAKQSLLFSATFSDEIRALAAGLLKKPVSIQVTPPNTTVQRIAQTIYPVGRNRKKDVLIHIINQHDWSQVLVFTRTKFGANKVADYLKANGISAMALHGNKSQTARTQALEGFKSGDIRALVATDIAARGIDIEDLPHVVNYDIPNVPEDYVHRIGRTGRAGAEGQAVSFVCLDEEGFMMEIERFTRQEIPVQALPEFGPEEGEQAEPIAMGRQVLWGGAGRAPGREVMTAAGRAARQDMMQRIRDKKASQGQRAPQGRRATAPRPRTDDAAPDTPAGSDWPAASDANPQGQPADEGAPQPPRNKSRSRRFGRNGRIGRDRNAPDGQTQAANGSRPPADGQGQPQPARAGQRPPRDAFMDGHDDEHDDHQEHLPRHINPLQTNLHNRRRDLHHSPVQYGPAGQPDPMRTSIDSMSQGSRKRGGNNASANPAPGNSYGGNKNRGSSRGNRSRGPGNSGR